MNYKPEEIGRFTYAITIILIVLLYLPHLMYYSLRKRWMKQAEEKE